MPDHSYTSRRELEEYRFSPVVAIAVPLVFLLLQAYVPKIFPRLLILDIPLLAVIFFAVARRNPIVGALTGAAIGLMQDALTGQPIGINGMAKSVIGYIASSIGVQVDVEKPDHAGADDLWFFPAAVGHAVRHQPPDARQLRVAPCFGCTRSFARR